MHTVTQASWGAADAVNAGKMRLCSEEARGVTCGCGGQGGLAVPGAGGGGISLLPACTA